MATDFRTLGADASAELDSVAPEPQLFRFRLRQLLAVVTLICLLLAAVVSSSGLAAAVLLLATLVVVFHIFSTVLATQLREHADQSIARHAMRNEAGASSSEFDRPVEIQLSRSPWHDRASTPLPWLPRFVLGVSFCGGILGAFVLALTNDRHASPAGIVVGSISIAVVAGWFSFLGYSFYGVFRHGLKQAMAEERRDPPA
jgi:hypothetical protein